MDEQKNKLKEYKSVEIRFQFVGNNYISMINQLAGIKSEFKLSSDLIASIQTIKIVGFRDSITNLNFKQLHDKLMKSNKVFQIPIKFGIRGNSIYLLWNKEFDEFISNTQDEILSRWNGFRMFESVKCLEFPNRVSLLTCFNRLHDLEGGNLFLTVRNYTLNEVY